MKATLSYLLDHPKYDQEKPYELWLPEEELAGADLPSTNCEFEERSDITIQDVRTSNLSFAFDTTGFKFVSDPLDEDYHCAGLLFKKDSTLERYLKQTVGLIKREFGTEKVICFDWRVHNPCFCS